MTLEIHWRFRWDGVEELAFKKFRNKWVYESFYLFFFLFSKSDRMGLALLI